MLLPGRIQKKPPGSKYRTTISLKSQLNPNLTDGFPQDLQRNLFGLVQRRS